ncbi:MAG: phosphate acyltransferase [Epulopiscium sp.]|uniref:Phosphate acyltransferase n=1 Tax=Defluviitalea raffinosedens TaxID=1450156 RepID=A0A7C8LMJ2_9FIRM|nr:phosphate acyltransferase PlsX [Defluviitalea raffinosedens]KAE9637183.1 phosphate acyltransferase PlsX [Defluviitalea raffinosedens]MBM7686513.1 glycerol-3-phosphate acyltransferase PlsX [Defluviitalea raffinosedens]MDK2789383.1 phosphate acyltransferase [Candidatus Epulonipiscium sp.]HHW66790.1 phosphate acyltransferase PlsX [Candidatus Epulonipiscium sp.]
MSDQVIVAVDAMGGDHAPREIVKGCIETTNLDDIKIILVGNEDQIKNELSQYTYDQSKISIAHASEVITMEDSPVTAIRKKKDSSMVVGLNLLKQKEADAFISAGNTGALLAGGTFLVGRIKGVERPALAPLIPNKKGFSLLIDCGANMDSKPGYLAQFAQMGSIYMEKIMGISSPKVGLVNVGAEKEKGNQLTKEAYSLIEALDVNFIGNIEARDIPYGEADVIVCDAFTGNIILKYTEGFGLALFDIIKEELTRNTSSKIGALLSKSAFKRVKNRFDYTEYGGAPMLGLQGLVVKAHGSSNAKAIGSAIRQAIKFKEQKIVDQIEQKINQ